MTAERPDGTAEFFDYRPTAFASTNFRAATAWTSYQDTDGNRHFVSMDFTCNFSKGDLRSMVGEMMKLILCEGLASSADCGMMNVPEMNRQSEKNTDYGSGFDRKNCGTVTKGRYYGAGKDQSDVWKPSGGV